MLLLRRLVGLRSARGLMFKRLFSINEEDEVREIVRIAAAEYYHFLKQKQLPGQEIANQLMEFQRRMYDQQLAMTRDLRIETEDVPTARSADS